MHFFSQNKTFQTETLKQLPKKNKVHKFYHFIYFYSCSLESNFVQIRRKK